PEPTRRAREQRNRRRTSRAEGSALSSGPYSGQGPMEERLLMTRRWSQIRSKSEVQLPPELRSFDTWLYPNGLHEYMAALSRFLGGSERLTPVMSAAGLSAAQWFHHMLTRPDTA